MSDDLKALASQLQSLSADERARLMALLAGGAAAAPSASPAPIHGDVNLSDDARINGVAVGVNLGTLIYGRHPAEDERRRLVWYLAHLSAKLYRLPLRGLEERLDQGEGMALPRVYVTLATESFVEVACGRTKELRRYYQEGKLDQPLKPEYDPDQALPDQAIVRVEPVIEPDDRRRASGTPPRVLARSLLATEAVHQHSRLVLLGDPGGGKSTFLRHLAWALARRGLDQRGESTALRGWADDSRQLPIFLSLRALAGRLARDGASDATVYAALRDEIQSCNITDVDDLLREALHRGAALLLFDGLDEVPLDAAPGLSVDRAATLRAIRTFAEHYDRALVVVTCRTRAFDERLRALLGWPVEILASLTLGQIRHFVPAWYAELVAKRQLEPAQAERLAPALIDQIARSPQLSTMAKTPLLLTLMALILYNKGELPRDRPQLYERVLELLLGQWDKVKEGQNLAEALDLPDLTSDRLRPMLDQLSYEAHLAGSSADGRGRLARETVRAALIAFFERDYPRRSWDLAQRCLDYIEQRSGLLMPDGTDSYVFAHLTLQEHCAGRAMLLDRDAAALVMRHRADDRWREPIFLGLGVVQQTNPWLIESVLRKLIEREEDEQPKLAERWQRDLILAAEIGQDRGWANLRDLRVDVGPLQRDLRQGLVALLGDKTQPLPVAVRVRAGFLLGDLGDPRIPVTLDDWRIALSALSPGSSLITRHSPLDDYFCRVEAGTYIIGSTAGDPEAQDAEKPQHTVTFDAPFWIARYPITNAQWQLWVQAGGEPARYADHPDLGQLNQPVVAITWHACTAFCTWLSEQSNATICLPTEQQWEAAARGGDARRYPWDDVWRDDRAATAEDQETRGQQYAVPVGCYPAGAAPCGALDMAGNVWEWTASSWQSYPVAAELFTDDTGRVLRGGGWSYTRNGVRCGARYWDYPDNWFDYDGFRVIVAPRLAR